MRYLFRRSISIILLVFSMTSVSMAQPPWIGVGDWDIHIPFNGVHSLGLASDKVYAGTELAMFSYNHSDKALETYTKLNKLNDIEVSAIDHHQGLNITLVAYANANIDLVKEDGTVNLPSIKNDELVADKSIYDLTFHGTDAYLATGFGVVVVNLVKEEIKFTTFFEGAGGVKIKVNGVYADDDYIYAASDSGLYRASQTSPNLIDFGQWKLLGTTEGLPSGAALAVQGFNNEVFIVFDNDLYKGSGSWTLFETYERRVINRLNANNNALTVSLLYDTSFVLVDSNLVLGYNTSFTEFFRSGAGDLAYPEDALLHDDGSWWFADRFAGLVKLETGVFTPMIPDGPGSSKAFQMKIIDGQLWVAPGEVNSAWNAQFNDDGFFYYDGYSWQAFNQFGYGTLDSCHDLVAVAPSANGKKVYFGSWGSGLIRYDRDLNNIVAFEEATSSLLETPGDPGSFRVPGLDFDSEGNLWMTNVSDRIHVLTSDGTFKYFDPSPSFIGFIQEMHVMDNGHLWMNILQNNSQGILVYDPGDDVMSTFDDRWTLLQRGQGNPENGDLSTNDVRCLVQDLDGEVWVGTTEGISVYYNPSRVFDDPDAAQIFVQQGEFTNYLLQNEIINDIVVDAANRKWIATRNGVRLVSQDGKTIIRDFREENSPLLSDFVNSIAYDEETGLVYFATNRGICSYRTEAARGYVNHDTVSVFPNPVAPEYTGPITISGLVDEANVKITNVNGELIFQTTALGGQVVWDRMDYQGNRAGSGVYFVMSSNFDGSEGIVTKFLLVE